MFHMCALQGSIAASQSNADLTAVQDNVFTIQNTRFLMPEPMSLMRAYAYGSSLNDCRLTVPSLRNIVQPRVYPIDKNAAPQNDPFINIYGDRGPKLQAKEEIGVQVDTDSSGTAQAQAFLWMTNGTTNPMSGPIYTIRATSSTVTTVGKWTAGSITLEAALPQGIYQLIGADAWGTNMGGLRFRFPNQIYMPGILTQQAVGEFMMGWQRNGRMGVFGEFDNVNIPSIEVYGHGTTTTQTIYLDILKVR